MRNSKIVALVAAAALLVVGAAFTAFAATGWVEESGSWKYYDKNGDEVTEAWAKSGNSWYWLGDDGFMATDALVDYNENYYYVGSNGAMVVNQWVAIENDGDDNYDDHIWYYFQGSGKAYKAASGYAWKTVNGKKYAFSEEGKMLYGWLDANEMVSNENDDAYASGIYYCGDNEDGARRTNAWEYMYIADGSDDAYHWFYFDNQGKKVVSAQKTINGKKYAFDANGFMAAEWATVSTDNAADIKTYGWFQDAETGAKLVNGWFKVVPAEAVDATDNEEETSHWFYADGKGNLKKSCIAAIGGKQYGFNDKGEMVSGLQLVKLDADGNYVFTAIDDAEKHAKYCEIGAEDVSGVKEGVMFFSDDEDTDGSRKTGNAKVDVDGDEYSYKFGTKGTKKGVGQTGRDGNYYYINGCKVTADGDMKVQVSKVDKGTAALTTVELGKLQNAYDIKDDYKSNEYVAMTASGVLVKNGSKTDADGFKVTVKNYVVTDIKDTNK